MVSMHLLSCDTFNNLHKLDLDQPEVGNQLRKATLLLALRLPELTNLTSFRIKFVSVHDLDCDCEICKEAEEGLKSALAVSREPTLDDITWPLATLTDLTIDAEDLTSLPTIDAPNLTTLSLRLNLSKLDYSLTTCLQAPGLHELWLKFERFRKTYSSESEAEEASHSDGEDFDSASLPQSKELSALLKAVRGGIWPSLRVLQVSLLEDMPLCDGFISALCAKPRPQLTEVRITPEHAPPSDVARLIKLHPAIERVLTSDPGFLVPTSARDEDEKQRDREDKSSDSDDDGDGGEAPDSKSSLVAEADVDCAKPPAPARTRTRKSGKQAAQPFAVSSFIGLRQLILYTADDSVFKMRFPNLVQLSISEEAKLSSLDLVIAACPRLKDLDLRGNFEIQGIVIVNKRAYNSQKQHSTCRHTQHK